MSLKNKKIIIPSAPFKEFGDLESLAMRAKGEVKRIQIDVCDGKYVASTSWPFTEYSKGDFEKLVNKKDLDVYLPFWEDIDYSVDLMVLNPEKYIESFVAYGINQIFVHFRSNPDWEKVFAQVVQYDLNFVLAVDVNTDLENFLKFAKENLARINGFQVMGIEKIGFQGQELDERSLDLVKILKKEFPEHTVYFDGGINEDTVEEISEAGVDVFCVGSYLTKSDIFEDNLHYLKNLLR